MNEVVVDARIPECARDGADGGADDEPTHRATQQHPCQETDAAATQRPLPRLLDGLFNLHVIGAEAFVDDDSVLDGEKAPLLPNVNIAKHVLGPGRALKT